jgi:hypothetical protein
LLGNYDGEVPMRTREMSSRVTHRISNPLADRRFPADSGLSRERLKLPSNGAFRDCGRSLRLVPLPVFKTALGFARGLVGSIPIFSRLKMWAD